MLDCELLVMRVVSKSNDVLLRILSVVHCSLYRYGSLWIWFGVL